MSLGHDATQQQFRHRRSPLTKLLRWERNRVRTQLVKLEHEISGIAHHWNGHTAARSSVRKKRRRRLAIFFATAKSRLSSLGASCKSCGRTLATSLRAVLNATIRNVPVRVESRRHPPAAGQGEHSAPPKRSRGAKKSGILSGILLAACFGLVSLGGILSIVLLLQIRDMKSEMALWKSELAATKLQLAKSEKRAQPVANTSAQSSATINSRPFRTSLSLSKDERKSVRQFIKVLPAKPGAKRTIELGAELSSSAAARVPQELVDHLPKLRGARFLVDHDGSIIIMADGSSRADVIIDDPQHQ